MNYIEATYELIKKFDIHARKKFGQNFLIDEHVLDKIILAAGVTKDDFVLEIGPGLGTLTRALCDRARYVLAIELDYDLVDILDRELNYDNLEIIQGDILKQSIAEISERYNNGRPIKVVANLPYYITTPIIMQLLEAKAPIESITVMVQKEVADRMLSKAGEKDCGAISLAIAYYCETYLAANVPPNCFRPRPRVSSAVIRLSILSNPPVTVRDEALMFKLIRAAFSQRRKTLINAIANSSELTLSKDEVSSAFETLDMDKNIRGEKLDLEAFATLSDFFTKESENL